jgi:hypothetical protein
LKKIAAVQGSSFCCALCGCKFNVFCSVCVGAGEDGIEMLLQIVYQYRKKDPEGADEKECVQNMFQCICTVMMDKENQAR